MQVLDPTFGLGDESRELRRTSGKMCLNGDRHSESIVVIFVLEGG